MPVNDALLMLMKQFGFYPRPLTLNRVLESQFKKWYDALASRNSLNRNPDDPLHYYDYRKAFMAGQAPSKESGHWSSEFKDIMHPNRFVGGVDTITGRPYGTKR